ncbi:MAG TPA: acetyl-CoA hydrolase/transferase family protein [Candidatus Sulfotelmatobacter sp.]|nr:acetyl-CoA hydrolase/transferase family protein [Candidatus Sulfotelmatobacter sp.]
MATVVSPTTTRVLNSALAQKIMSAEEAAALIKSGDQIGMSGFTGSGYPKVVPIELAHRIADAHFHGQKFQVSVFTGASTGPELDGALAMAGGIHLRLPYQSDPETRKRINAGEMDYMDIHLSHVAQFVEYGFLGKLNVALIEVTAVLEDGRLVPSSSIGNNKTWIDQADRVILEVNSWQPAALEGMHDIYYGLQPPPNRGPIPLVSPGQRIGTPYLEVPAEKVVAIVLTDSPDRNSAFKPPDAASKLIAGHILEFLNWEVQKGRMPANLLPLQSGVGNIANAVLFGLEEGPFEGLTSYTEVIQDGMIRLLKSGKVTSASATAFSLSPEMLTEVNADMASYRERIILRPQEISNHPEIIRRLGVIAMNGMIEADIYGNVNSTHVMGSRIQNGIGGSGDFARNGYLSIFMAPSTAQHGTISTIVPMVSHVDHTEHDVQVIVTEHGLADLRGLSPRQRAHLIIEKCSNPDYKPLLLDYLNRAERLSYGKHTPHLLGESLGWHNRYLRCGKMKPQEEN